MIKSLAAERCAPVLILLDHLSHLERNLTSFMKKKWNSSIIKWEQSEFWAKENEDASEASFRVYVYFHENSQNLQVFLL